MKLKVKLFAMLAMLPLFAFVLWKPFETANSQTAAQTAGQKFKNIKVLNEMPADQMGKVMNLMSASLGVNCNYCHVSEEDFAADGKEEKETAREMIKMTFALNKNYFDNRPEISCNTCHNGKTHPQSAPNLNPIAAIERPKQPTVKPSVDAILEKYVAAIGGKANLAKITSRYVKAVRVEPDGKTSEPEEIWQRADKMLVTTKYGDYIVSEGFDGKTAWKRGDKNTIALKADEAEQIKREAQIFSLADFKTIYSALEFRFVDKIDGREVYTISATTADNLRERLYFDVGTNLLVRRTAATPTVLGSFQYQVDYSDYKDFGGVKLPTTIRYAMPNVSWTRKITEVKNNAAIDDAKFNQPTK